MMSSLDALSVFNEPYGAGWLKWKGFVQRIGAQILQDCPRWLVLAQGVDGTGWWWGENIQDWKYYGPVEVHTVAVDPGRGMTSGS